ncbi:hypothetical protein BO85DRAFT_148341 [Aspergillus piperis CBS 112811]|uniref:Uncharacterized protein n=1 Tax=Aspergillus piperis CBS 112811 TaxID=1448313 RepID=A0A8G1QVY1_9EURO|nr:hypothetical protein BO85DRAFT_148341 [Aspergillus piperis CBS 112811]RAH53971.1 hypothetical protein BO85DRAFT_148341 [Aspergillus piperis CBS 112811]
MCKEFVIYGFGFPLNKQPDPAAFCWPACVFYFFSFPPLFLILVSTFVSYPHLLSKPPLLLHRGPQLRQPRFRPLSPVTRPFRQGYGLFVFCNPSVASCIGWRIHFVYGLLGNIFI